MPTISVEITDVEFKALAYVAVDPNEWITNLVKTRAAAAMDEIYQAEIVRMTNDPTVHNIPANRDTVVLEADVKSAAERHEEGLAAIIISTPGA